MDLTFFFCAGAMDDAGVGCVGAVVLVNRLRFSGFPLDGKCRID